MTNKHTIIQYYDGLRRTPPRATARASRRCQGLGRAKHIIIIIMFISIIIDIDIIIIIITIVIINSSIAMISRNIITIIIIIIISLLLLSLSYNNYYYYHYGRASPKRQGLGRARRAQSAQDSSKGGAVETGCSGLHYIIGRFMI